LNSDKFGLSISGFDKILKQIGKTNEKEDMKTFYDETEVTAKNYLKSKKD
jgi:hypothetical protein